MRKKLPDAFIWKVPDFKQGAKGMGGIPDYMIIDNCETFWYEVKSSFGDTITLAHFTDGQKIMFPKMLKAGAMILIYAFTKTKGPKIFEYTRLLREGKIKFS